MTFIFKQLEEMTILAFIKEKLGKIKDIVAGNIQAHDMEEEINFPDLLFIRIAFEYANMTFHERDSQFIEDL